ISAPAAYSAYITTPVAASAQRDTPAPIAPVVRYTPNGVAMPPTTAGRGRGEFFGNKSLAATRPMGRPAGSRTRRADAPVSVRRRRASAPVSYPPITL